MNYTLDVIKVESDDYGDERWQYYAVLKKGDSELWSDYFTKEPDLEQMLELALDLVSTP